MKPLDGIRVIEMAGLAPAPYAGMILADFGADVVRVDRSPTSGAKPDPARDPLARGKRSIGLNLKDPRGVELLLQLIEGADVLLEPFRPGVMEKLGAGPDVACTRNARLVYARLTGWGQGGDYGPMAGHDINYIALSGALSCFARQGQKPLPPVNLLGDFAGGGMLCALGIVLALFEREQSGKGQIIDAAMVDGAANLATFLFGFRAAGFWSDEAGTNLLDSGAPFYDTYATADGKFVSVGAIEPQFYARLLGGLGLNAEEMPHQYEREAWAATAARFSEIFKTRTRDQWAEIFDGTDACVAPILSLLEAPSHRHNRTRGTFTRASNGHVTPQAAPKLSRTPGVAALEAPLPGADTVDVLSAAGVSVADLAQLRSEGVVG